jgi:hypothetical protein
MGSGVIFLTPLLVSARLLILNTYRRIHGIFFCSCALPAANVEPTRLN